MWLDNASEVDILFYEPYANVIADISQNPNYKPLTIGVFGVWGAGKSTLLKLRKHRKRKKHYVLILMLGCLRDMKMQKWL